MSPIIQHLNGVLRITGIDNREEKMKERREREQEEECNGPAHRALGPGKIFVSPKDPRKEGGRLLAEVFFPSDFDEIRVRDWQGLGKLLYKTPFPSL